MILLCLIQSNYASELHEINLPPSSEFGLGPKSSQKGIYKVSIVTPEPLRKRRMQSIRAHVTDINGNLIENANILIDGGMPQHNHGLPTKPRVTKNLGQGDYQIEGLRFNMGGWWEVKLFISSEFGEDTVIFNIDL